MAAPYVYERQTEYWTSRGIEEYFLNAGFQVLTYPITQMAEGRVIPFDFVFHDPRTCKLFGLQYKALYKGQHDYWPLDEHQHVLLQRFEEWGYYALSEVKTCEQLRVALHHALFVPVKMDFRSEIRQGTFRDSYYRWGGFAEGLERCHVGKRVQSESELRTMLRPFDRAFSREIDGQFVDLFVSNMERRRIIHIDGGAS